MDKMTKDGVKAALDSIKIALEAMEFKVYMVYGYGDLKNVGIHIDPNSFTKENTTKLVLHLGLLNFGWQPEGGTAGWILFPHNYGGLSIYLSLQPHGDITKEELVAFAHAMQDLVAMTDEHQG